MSSFVKEPYAHKVVQIMEIVHRYGKNQDANGYVKLGSYCIGPGFKAVVCVVLKSAPFGPQRNADMTYSHHKS